MTLKNDLERIVPPNRVSDDAGVLERYSRDYSLVKARMPACVVCVTKSEEVQGVVRYANERLIPVTPRSSVPGFHGSGIPPEGGIVIDLTGMNRILEINSRHKKVKVEPGVTWSQVHEELRKRGMMVSSPLLPHPAKSVLTTALEREPLANPRWEYGETFLTGEVVLPEGDIVYLGAANQKKSRGQHFPDGSFPNRRVFMGAQGTLGILTWAYLKAEMLPREDDIQLLPLDRMDDIPDLLYQVQHRLVGGECFVLNSVNLAAMLVGGQSLTSGELRRRLPPFLIVLCLSGGDRLPAEKIAYEKEALDEITGGLRFKTLPAFGGIPGLGQTMLGLLRAPWQAGEYWKFRPKGACQDIFFYGTMDRWPEFTHAIQSVAGEHGYPVADIGSYLQPVERGLSAYYQYGFYYDPKDADEVQRVRALLQHASQVAFDMGGLFTTPYGTWAEMVYARAESYAEMLRVVKRGFDPNNIMNPGRLCF